MKVTILLLVFLSSYACNAQCDPDAILGRWVNIPKENTIIEVFKTNSGYSGKILWAKDNDEKKPIGFVILEKLEFNSRKQIWENGKIHDPNSTNTYKAFAKIESDGNLELHGYMGFKFLGTTKNFKKIN